MHNLVAIGGTFDHLHKGHEAFLRAAFARGKRVLIGLTSDRMAGKKNEIFNFQFSIFNQIQNFQTRKQNLLELLRKNKWTERAEIISINDVYGPTLECTDIEALVVTTETEQGARMINALRRKKKLPPLPVIVTNLVLAEDHRRIASTRIREGDIDRSGRLYRNLSIFGGKIPEVVRQRLKKPLGRVIKPVDGEHSEIYGPGQPPSRKASDGRGRPAPAIVITVGDVVTKYLNEIDIQKIDIAIVDFRVNRKAIHTSLADVGFTHEKIRNYIVTSVKNPPGYITNTVVRAVDRAIERRLTDGKRSIIRVLGEEDLAGVPAILCAPLGSIVIYGQPGEGMVMVEVTEEKKEEIIRTLSAI